MKVFIHDTASSTSVSDAVAVQVRMFDTVLHLLQKLHALQPDRHYDPATVHLFYAGRVLKNDERLAEIGVGDGALLLLGEAHRPGNEKLSSGLEPYAGTHWPAELRQALSRAQAGVAAGLMPRLSEEGEGGTYFMPVRKDADQFAEHDDGGSGSSSADAEVEYVACFKPRDEELCAPRNPKRLTGSFGMPGLRAGVLSGEAYAREVAAYVLDHGGFAGVPPTALVNSWHVGFNNGPPDPTAPAPKLLRKLGSFQLFVADATPVEDFGPSKLPDTEVQKVALFDLRLLNLDRNGDNLLVKWVMKEVNPPVPSPSSAQQQTTTTTTTMAVARAESVTPALTSTAAGGAGDGLSDAPPSSSSSGAGVGAWRRGAGARGSSSSRLTRRRVLSPVLVPIDHGYCLPSDLGIAWCDLVWFSWPAVRRPLNDEFKAYVAALDAEADIALLRAALGPAIRPQCYTTLRVTTLLLKRCIGAGMSLADVAGILCRMGDDLSAPSILERIVQTSSLGATAAMHNARIRTLGTAPRLLTHTTLTPGTPRGAPPSSSSTSSSSSSAVTAGHSAEEASDTAAPAALHFLSTLTAGDARKHVASVSALPLLGSSRDRSSDVNSHEERDVQLSLPPQRVGSDAVLLPPSSNSPRAVVGAWGGAAPPDPLAVLTRVRSFSDESRQRQQLQLQRLQEQALFSLDDVSHSLDGKATIVGARSGHRGGPTVSASLEGLHLESPRQLRGTPGAGTRSAAVDGAFRPPAATVQSATVPAGKVVTPPPTNEGRVPRGPIEQQQQQQLQQQQQQLPRVRTPRGGGVPSANSPSDDSDAAMASASAFAAARAASAVVGRQRPSVRVVRLSALTQYLGLNTDIPLLWGLRGEAVGAGFPVGDSRGVEIAIGLAAVSTSAAPPPPPLHLPLQQQKQSQELTRMIGGGATAPVLMHPFAPTPAAATTTQPQSITSGAATGVAPAGVPLSLGSHAAPIPPVSASGTTEALFELADLALACGGSGTESAPPSGRLPATPAPVHIAPAPSEPHRLQPSGTHDLYPAAAMTPSSSSRVVGDAASVAGAGVSAAVQPHANGLPLRGNSNASTFSSLGGSISAETAAKMMSASGNSACNLPTVVSQGDVGMSPASSEISARDMSAAIDLLWSSSASTTTGRCCGDAADGSGGCGCHQSSACAPEGNETVSGTGTSVASPVQQHAPPLLPLTCAPQWRTVFGCHVAASSPGAATAAVNASAAVGKEDSELPRVLSSSAPLEEHTAGAPGSCVCAISCAAVWKGRLLCCVGVPTQSSWASAEEPAQTTSGGVGGGPLAADPDVQSAIRAVLASVLAASAAEFVSAAGAALPPAPHRPKQLHLVPARVVPLTRLILDRAMGTADTSATRLYAAAAAVDAFAAGGDGRGGGDLLPSRLSFHSQPGGGGGGSANGSGGLSAASSAASLHSEIARPPAPGVSSTVPSSCTHHMLVAAAAAPSRQSVGPLLLQLPSGQYTSATDTSYSAASGGMGSGSGSVGLRPLGTLEASPEADVVGAGRGPQGQQQHPFLVPHSLPSTSGAASALVTTDSAAPTTAGAAPTTRSTHRPLAVSTAALSGGVAGARAATFSSSSSSGYSVSTSLSPIAEVCTPGPGGSNLPSLAPAANRQRQRSTGGHSRGHSALPSLGAPETDGARDGPKPATGSQVATLGELSSAPFTAAAAAAPQPAFDDEVMTSAAPSHGISSPLFPTLSRFQTHTSGTRPPAAAAAAAIASPSPSASPAVAPTQRQHLQQQSFPVPGLPLRRQASFGSAIVIASPYLRRNTSIAAVQPQSTPQGAGHTRIERTDNASVTGAGSAGGGEAQLMLRGGVLLVTWGPPPHRLREESLGLR